MDEEIPEALEQVIRAGELPTDDKHLFRLVVGGLHPIVLLRGFYDGEPCSLLCLALNEKGQGIYGESDLKGGPGKIIPWGLLRAFNEEDLQRLVDPDGVSLIEALE